MDIVHLHLFAYRGSIICRYFIYYKNAGSLKVRNDFSYLARTDPRDVARVESKTFICTENRRDTIPTSAEGVAGQLGNWEHPDIMKKKLEGLFSGCMEGKKGIRSLCEKYNLYTTV